MRAAVAFELWIYDGIFLEKADDESGYLNDDKRENNPPPNHTRLETEGGDSGDDGDWIKDWRGKQKTDDIGGFEAAG